MESVVLLIRWFYGREQVKVLVGPDPRDNEIQHTDEYWPDYDRTVRYHTTSERRVRPDGSQRILIHYSRKANGDLICEFGPDSWLWGTSTIVVGKERSSATVTWQGNPPAPLHDGKAPCRVLSQDLFKEEEREFVSRGKRKQQEFRRLLIDYQECCAITGEATPSALEAAHVFAAASGGGE